MKTLTSIVVAGALAATTIAATATGASAGGWNNSGGWNNHRPHFQHGPQYDHGPRPEYRSGPDAGGALLAGAFLGLAFGAIASQSFAEPEPEPIYLPPPHPNYAAADAHFTWCTRTYSSYNGERDTFIDFQNIERPCVDPYH